MHIHEQPEAPDESSESLLSTEELRSAYRDIDALRAVNTHLSMNRTKFQLMQQFLLRVMPAFVREKLEPVERLDLPDLERIGIDPKTFTPLVGLGAFNLEKVRSGSANFDSLHEAGIGHVVLMEDRDPDFFLNHTEFDEAALVPMNRHKKWIDRWTHGDLKHLVEGLHESGVKALVGFWSNTGNRLLNPFIAQNWEALRPVIPSSDDFNPLCFVRDKAGSDMCFADYVTTQFEKLHRDFGFDGLFLGDGLMGYRAFMDPYGPYDARETIPLWTDFFKRIHAGLKSTDPTMELWAYDCMGNGSKLARRNGVDLAAIAPCLDRYVFQAYGNDAWGSDYMSLPGYGLARDREQIQDLPEELSAKTVYTIGLNDEVEGWHSQGDVVRAKHKALRSQAKAGTLGVWSDNLVLHLAA